MTEHKREPLRFLVFSGSLRVESLNSRLEAADGFVIASGRDTTNAADEIFPTGGDPALLDLTLTAAGHRAVI